MNSICAIADVCDDGRIGRGDLRQRRDFAGMIHADLPNRDFVLRSCLQNRPRKTDVIVEIAFGLGDAEFSRQNRCGKIFRARLAVAAGNREHLEWKRFSIIRSQILIGAQCVSRANERELRRERSLASLHRQSRRRRRSWRAPSTNLWPSKFSPRRATKSSPGFSVRESVLTFIDKISIAGGKFRAARIQLFLQNSRV